MSTTSNEQAAGAMVWRRLDGIVEVLIAHRPRYDDWTFPKGKLDADESLIECALREVREETGLRCSVGRHLGTTRFAKPNGRPKEVSYWAMNVIDGTFAQNEEVDEVGWVAQADLVHRLTYKIDQDLVATLDESWTDPPDRILLIRHAHAGDRFSWSGEEDAHRPLSVRGHAQVDNIRSRLTSFVIDRILTSPATRCLETVASISDARSLTLEPTDLLWESAPYDDVVGLVSRSKVGSTVFCSHGPIVAMIIHSLTGSAAGVPMEKASTWVLDFAGDSLLAANYLAPQNSTPR